MSRIERKNIDPTYMGLRHRGGITDAFDDMIKSSYRISDDEYDALCLILSDKEMDIVFGDKKTFAQKRATIQTLNKYINY
jgi:hypothetical protein